MNLEILKGNVLFLVGRTYRSRLKQSSIVLTEEFEVVYRQLKKMYEEEKDGYENFEHYITHSSRLSWGSYLVRYAPKGPPEPSGVLKQQKLWKLIEQYEEQNDKISHTTES